MLKKSEKHEKLTNQDSSKKLLSKSALLPFFKSNLLHDTECLTPYELALMRLYNDKKWQQEVTIDQRIGFYHIKNEIGAGNFSHVRMAVHYLTGEKVAIKILDKSNVNEKVQKMVIREIILMQKLDHPNIIKIYETIETFTKIYIVMEYAHFGELFQRINSQGKLDENQAKIIFLQVISAIEYLHSKNIIHRDIKAQNIFFADKLTVKLGDFGFSVQLKEKNQLLSSFCGSPSYAAPELFKDKHYIGKYVDIWALGVLLYYMVTASLPFNGKSIPFLKKIILQGKYFIPNYLSDECQTLIKGILQHEPENRLSLAEITSISWLNYVQYPEPLGNINDTFKSDKATISRMKAMPEDEREALLVLEKMGITKEMIEKNIDKGLKSNIIGVYRIILHRTALNRFHRSFENVYFFSADKDKKDSKILRNLKSFNSRSSFSNNSNKNRETFKYFKSSRKICKIM